MIDFPETGTTARTGQAISDAELDNVSGGLILTTLFLAAMVANTIKPGTVPFVPSFRKD